MQQIVDLENPYDSVSREAAGGPERLWCEGKLLKVVQSLYEDG